ncbi:hypothetical protein ACF0H5_018171 [Mactra antiquata]
MEMRKVFFSLCVICYSVYADSTLRLVNLVYRHGDRSPIVIYPTDPNGIDNWPQGLGWLSKIGIQQQYRLGQWLRQRYFIDTKFMNTSYNREEISVTSSDEDRCLMSAYSNLAGLYPPTEDEQFDPDVKWQPIPVFTKPEKEDNMLNMGQDCPRYTELFDETLKSHAVQAEEQENKAFYKFLGEKTTWNHENISNIWKIADTTVCEKAHNLTLPSWLSDTVYKRLRILEAYQFTLMFNGTEKSMLKGGPLLSEFIYNMMLTVNRPTFAKVKMFMYSAHDTTVAALLSALGLYDKKSPQYTAMVIAELHENPTGKFYVNLFYKNVTDDPTAHLLTLPNCVENCPIEDFIRLTKDAVPTSWLTQCQVPNSSSSSFTLATGWIVSIVLGAILCILLIVVIVYYIRVRRNKDIAFRKFDM